MVPIIGIASGIGAGNPGCGQGPHFLHRNPDFLKEIDAYWAAFFSLPESPKDAYEKLQVFYEKAAQKIYEIYQQEGYLLSIGGDHSCAIATWSGVAEALRPSGDLGLLWIDAHMDSHTPETSESGNIHGMPLAALLGYGDSRLTQILSDKPKIHPENLVLIGIRSYESGEANLLQSLGVRIYYIEEVKERGLQAVMEEAIDKVSKNTAGYGVSLDLDSMDPLYFSAVGTPVDNGLHPEELLACFSCFSSRPPVTFEIVEYNPFLDPDLKSAQLLLRILRESLIPKFLTR